MVEEKKISKEEKIARERVENSPLQFLITRYSGNHSNRTVNLIPKPDQASFRERRSDNEPQE